MGEKSKVESKSRKFLKRDEQTTATTNACQLLYVLGNDKIFTSNTKRR